MAKTVGSFLVGNPSGLVSLAHVTKKKGVDTTFTLLRESGVKVRITFIGNIGHKRTNPLGYRY